MGHYALGYIHGRTRHWFIPDALGSIREVVADTGRILTYLYDEYGGLSSKEDQPALGFLYMGALGVYSDAGLVCANMRWYEPAAGRFLSTDPSGTAGGLNLYEYSNQSPVNYVDATGLEPKSQEFINKVMRRGNVYVGASAIYWGGMGVTGFNCGGDTFCAQTGERPRYIPPDLAIAGLSKLGSLRFDLVDPRFRPQIGDVADLSDHCATVVDFVGGGCVHFQSTRKFALKA